MLPSGQDVDQDGLDDACDPDITAAPAGAAQPGVAVTNVTAQTTPSQRADFSNVHDGPAAGTVLGDVTNALTAVPKSVPSASLMTSKDQQLYRLNWITVLAVGVGLSIGITLAAYCMRSNQY